LSGINWGTAVVPSFSGSFDGNDLTICHLKIRGQSYLGLFGRLAYGAEVKNLWIVDANIVGSGDCVGGLVGMNGDGGTVTKCHSTSEVSGNHSVGGLVGFNGYGSHVTQCYSVGVVSGSERVGGMVGGNIGTVSQSYSTGAVSGSGRVGGLVGDNGSSVTASFWDTQTSGQATSAGGVGLTTAEMQTASTFLDAGWDFIGETANGTEDIWWINEGKDYPRLWWESDEASQF
jgi:hypothetical protein